MFLFLFEKSSKVINFLFSYLDFSSMFFSCFHLWEYLFIFAMIDVIWYYQNEGNSCFYPSSICVSVILCLHFGTFLFSTIFSHYSYHHISQVAVFLLKRLRYHAIYACIANHFHSVWCCRFTIVLLNNMYISHIALYKQTDLCVFFSQRWIRK